MLGNHTQGRKRRAVRSESSDTGLGCSQHRSLYGEECSGEIGLFGEALFKSFGGTQGKLLPRWEEGENVGIIELTGEHLVCDERGVHAARTIRRHAPSGRWCSDKI